MAIRNDLISETSKKAKPIQQQWAAYVRSRWPRNTLGELQREFELTEGEARRLLYGHGSLKAIQKACNHKNGGVMLEVDMTLQRWGMTLSQFADKKNSEREHARNLQEACDQSERLALSRLAGREGVEG